MESEISVKVVLRKLQQAFDERTFRKNGLVESSTSIQRASFPQEWSCGNFNKHTEGELSVRMGLWKLQQAYRGRAFRKNGLVET